MISKVDGYFGKQTLAIVNLYKDKYGLANTGDYAGWWIIRLGCICSVIYLGN